MTQKDQDRFPVTMRWRGVQYRTTQDGLNIAKFHWNNLRKDSSFDAYPNFFDSRDGKEMRLAAMDEMIRGMVKEGLAVCVVHKFEAAGLGKAPFAFTGMSVSKYQSCPGAPVQPGSTCDYCGNSIMYVMHIRSSDGKLFKVGSDCVCRTGDEGLKKAIDRDPTMLAIEKEKRQAAAVRRREKAAARRKATQERLNDILASQRNRDVLATYPHPNGFTNRESGAPLSLLDWAVWMSRNGGENAWNCVLRTICTKI